MEESQGFDKSQELFVNQIADKNQGYCVSHNVNKSQLVFVSQRSNKNHIGCAEVNSWTN
jgi:hypothetical protein